jgi:acetyltransferase-like isoleucine patch superfamily enzyme
MNILNLILRRLRMLFWTWSSRRRLSLAGIAHGADLVTYGVPIVQRTDGSRIQIGPRVVLCSDGRYTPIGVSRPVTLRTLRSGASIEIGADSGLSGAVICASSRVSIGERCLLGADCKILDTDFHPVHALQRRRLPESEAATAPISIGDDVFVGTGALILKGVTIGSGSVIAAEAVVTRDVPAGQIFAGNPAKFIGMVKADPTIQPKSAA